MHSYYKVPVHSSSKYSSTIIAFDPGIQTYIIHEVDVQELHPPNANEDMPA
jgi:hypothetical protein